jgi:hypothetical protein
MKLELKFAHVDYNSLNARQQENYNFQKISGILADYGFSTVRLTQDWQGADFIAQHADGTTFLKVQLKGRLHFSKKYMEKDLWLCFRNKEDVYLLPHDEILRRILSGEQSMEATISWSSKGRYGWRQIPKWAEPLLQEYKLCAK